MNPETDTVTQVRLAEGRIVTVIQPGARMRGSRNARLSEDSFRAYESHIREAITAWPKETCFAVPVGMSPNTFEHRLRAAIQALIVFGYEPELQKQLATIRGEIVVSQDNEGKNVWIREKAARGRPVQMHRGEVGVRQLPPIAQTILPNPTEEVLRAYLVLAAAGQRTDPIQFRGKIAETLVTTLQNEFDTAFVYDEVSDLTTML